MKILQLGIHPLLQPRRREQIRAAQIKKKLEALGHSVLSLAVAPQGQAQEDGEHVLTIKTFGYKRPFDLPSCLDLWIGRLSETDSGIFNFLKRHVRAFAPDVVLLEQPWLWPGVRRLRNEGGLPTTTPIIYSSHFVESRRKADSLDRGADPDAVRSVLGEIAAIEADLVRHAAALVCANHDDGRHFQALTNQRVLVCPNGAASRESSPDAVNALRAAPQDKKYALFVGSACASQARDFWQMMGPSLAFISPDQMLVVAGGAGESIRDHAPEEAQLFARVNASVIRSTGQVSDEVLAALIDNAACIILPITSGHGGNVKAAEALASNKPVVATSLACSGFGGPEQFGHLTIADDPIEFVRAVRDALAQAPCHPAPDSIGHAELLHWEHTLKDLTDLFLPAAA